MLRSDGGLMRRERIAADSPNSTKRSVQPVGDTNYERLRTRSRIRVVLDTAPLLGAATVMRHRRDIRYRIDANTQRRKCTN